MLITIYDAIQIIGYILTTIGFWGIFVKCGVKSFWSLIPFAREYHLSLCADRENDGRILTVLTVIEGVVFVMGDFKYDDSRILVVLAIIYIAVQISEIIYMARIYYGLTKIFNHKKTWVICFLLFEGPTAVIWGYSPKFTPSRQVVNYKHNDEAKTFGSNIDSIDKGLTININKRSVFDFFSRKMLLKDIHMAIPYGHMVLLLGASGAGKTTFVNAVTGYEKADAQILLNGHDVYNEYSKMMYDIGFVPQQDLMRGNDTVALTLSDAASLRLPASINIFERIKRIDDVLEQFGLSSVKNSLVEKLSGGQRKRLSIAMEYISDPTLFILDEPDSGLDGLAARNLFEKLRTIADQGKIVIVITHTPDRVIDLFDDVIVLAKDARRTGRLAFYGSTDEALTFFGKKSMEDILLSVNAKEDGAEGRADEFIEKYADRMKAKVG